MCSTTHCQVYKGLSLETPQIEEAVSSLCWIKYLTGKMAGIGILPLRQRRYNGIVSWACGCGADSIPSGCCSNPMPALGPHSSWQCSHLCLFEESPKTCCKRNKYRVCGIPGHSRRDESGRVSLIDVLSSTQHRHKFRIPYWPNTLVPQCSTLTRSQNRWKQYLYRQSALKTAKLESNINTAKIDKSKMPKDQKKLVWLTKNKIFTTRERKYALAFTK